MDLPWHLEWQELFPVETAQGYRRFTHTCICCIYMKILQYYIQTAPELGKMGSLQAKLQGMWALVILFNGSTINAICAMLLHTENTVSAINPRKKWYDFISVWKTDWELLFFSILHRKLSFNSVHYFSESLEKKTLSCTSVQS